MKYFNLIFKLIAISSLTFSNLNSQTDEYLKHIESIRQNEVIRRTESEIPPKDSTFLDYAIRNIIKPNELIYITNRNLLEDISVSSCKANEIKMKGKIDSKEIAIKIKIKDFDTFSNTIEWSDNGDITSINGQIPLVVLTLHQQIKFNQ